MRRESREQYPSEIRNGEPERLIERLGIELKRDKQRWFDPWAVEVALRGRGERRRVVEVVLKLRREKEIPLMVRTE